MADNYFICGSCDHPFTEIEQGGPVRECTSCGAMLTGDDAGRCEQCHRFTAKYADASCPECEAPEEDEDRSRGTPQEPAAERAVGDRVR